MKIQQISEEQMSGLKGTEPITTEGSPFKFTLTNGENKVLFIKLNSRTGAQVPQIKLFWNDLGKKAKVFFTKLISGQPKFISARRGTQHTGYKGMECPFYIQKITGVMNVYKGKDGEETTSCYLDKEAIKQLTFLEVK